MEVQEKARKMLNEFAEKSESQSTRKLEESYSIIPGRETIVQKLNEALRNAKVSVYTATSKIRFSEAISEFYSDYQKASRKGVIIKLAVDEHVPNQAALELLRNLLKNPSFQVKCFASPPPAIVSIFDEKEACVTMSAKAHLAGASALWSSNSSFVEIAQAYFEKKWNEANQLVLPHFL